MSEQKLTYKMIILGDAAVGKTSLFKKLTTEQFDPKVISTIGIDKRTLSIVINTEDEGEKDLDIYLFDTAGEERYRTISVSYFRDSKGLLMMYDITKNESFQNIEDWLKNIKESLGDNDDYLMILLGNKLDLVNINKDEREVDTEEAKNFCEKNNIFWGGECSVKDIAIEDLKNMFKSFIEEIYKKVGHNVERRNSSVLMRSKTKKTKKKCC
jgi:small GTP-binding protein